MDIWYDSEFIDTGRKILPISIGFHREDGEELYRIWDSRLTISRAIDQPWLKENVVSSLPIKYAAGDAPGAWSGWIWDENHPDFECVKSPLQIKADVEAFLLEPDRPVTLWAWWAPYDFVLYAQLWGKMLDIPRLLPSHTCDLRQEHLRLGEPNLPRQTAGKHNALADARHNRLVHETLREVERSRIPGSPRVCYNPDCEQ